LFLFERKVQNAAFAVRRRIQRGQMEQMQMTDLHSRLMNQSLGRPLSAEERALADALEAVFRSGCHDFEEVARALEQNGVKRPSGAKEPWTAAALEQELATINTSLDAAYAEHGIGA
jgi:recombinase-like protein